MITKFEKRLRQIDAAANSYSIDNCVSWDYDSATGKYNESDELELSDAFCAGVAFADANPRTDLLEVDDVVAIYNMWLVDDNDNSDFIEYFVNYCEEEGWL